MRKLYSTIFIIFIIMFFLSSTSLALNDNLYTWSSSFDSVSTMNNTSSKQTNLNLESASAILIEQNSGKVLFEKNPHEVLRPASVTKVMTILLIMEALDER